MSTDNAGPSVRLRWRFTSAHKREMARLWVEEELSFNEIARRFGCSSMTPRRAVIKYVRPETRERVLRERDAPVL